MNTYIIDSSFMIALIITDDTNHHKVLDFFARIGSIEHRFIMSDLIYSETLTILRNKKIDNCYQIITDLISQFEILIFSSHNMDYIRFAQNLPEHLSVCDCSIIHDAKQYGAVPLSFDEKLMKYYLQS
jgi:predicted nucleic acid-binding protein